jgi:dihydrofolate reductase
MRELVYYVAASVDGYIAADCGSLNDFVWSDDYGRALFEMLPETFPVHLRPRAIGPADNRRFDTVVMGSATYRVGLEQGVRSPYDTLKQYVFSRSLRGGDGSSVEIIRDDACAFVADLKAREGRDIWLCGGSRLAGSLLGAGLVDRLLIKTNPVIFGCGIPLFAPGPRVCAARLEQLLRFPSDHVLLDYALA